MSEPRFLPCGDAGLSVEFGQTASVAVSERVLALDAVLRADPPPGLVETVPTFRALAVHLDPLVTDAAAMEAAIRPRLAGLAEARGAGRRWRVPVSYAPSHAPDLEDVQRLTGLSRDEVVALHAGPELHVYMIGFLPGHPYMGDVPEPLRLPRLAEPRTRVPRGGVAIATAFSAIYPVESPGGWRLIGRTPLPLFDLGREPVALLQPADKVIFQPITEAEFDALARDAAAGRWSPEPEA
jgi:KipI family sensor histidine kinase inhibitor